MIKHIVMWKLKEGSCEQMHKFLEALQGLKGQIEYLRDFTSWC